MDAFFGHKQTTIGPDGPLTVRVAVSFLPEQSQPSRHRWFWSYHIRIENDGREPVQLLTRRWEISDMSGSTHVVEGQGVVGAQPVIQPGTAYDYVSGCPLAVPSGQMVGRFGMITADGTPFDIAIPAFPLAAPAVQS